MTITNWDRSFIEAAVLDPGNFAHDHAPIHSSVPIRARKSSQIAERIIAELQRRFDTPEAMARALNFDSSLMKELTAMAFDNRGRRMGRDQEMDEELFNKLLALLHEEIGNGDRYEDAVQMVKRLVGAGGGAEDDPPPFEGRPTPGGEPLPLNGDHALALDARLRGRAKAATAFAKRYPNTGRIVIDGSVSRPLR
jgi:hypothetical protein